MRRKTSLEVANENILKCATKKVLYYKLTQLQHTWDDNKCMKCTYDDLHSQKPHTKTQVKQSTQANNNSQIWMTGQTRGWEKEKFTHRSLSLSFSLCRLVLCSSPIRMTAARMPAFLELTLASESDMLSGSHSTDLGPGLSCAILVRPSSLPRAEGLRIYISLYLSPSHALSLSFLLSLTPTPVLIACLCLDLIGWTEYKPRPLIPSPSLPIPLSLFHLLRSWTVWFSVARPFHTCSIKK